MLAAFDDGLRDIEGFLTGDRGSVTVACLPSMAATFCRPRNAKYRSLNSPAAAKRVHAGIPLSQSGMRRPHLACKSIEPTVIGLKRHTPHSRNLSFKSTDQRSAPPRGPAYATLQPDGFGCSLLGRDRQFCSSSSVGGLAPFLRTVIAAAMEAVRPSCSRTAGA